MTRDWLGEEDSHLSPGDLLAQWLIRTAGSPLTGRAWRLTNPLDRGSRFVEAAPPAPCTVIGEPRAGGQAAVARGVVSGYGEPVAIRLMLASTDPKAQQRERLQVGIGQLSRSHRHLLPALVRTVESFLMSVPAANFYNPEGQLQPGSSTVEVWGHVLEWCPKTLSDEIVASGGRGLGAEVVVRGMLPVMRTLRGMHELGYIHRDLDPSNILVAEDGGLRVADFGIAVQMRAEHTHTMTEAWGKPGRMPPEALAGQHVPVGPAYDAWQAGFLIAETATGSRPVLPGGGFSPRLNDLPKPVRSVVRELLEPARDKRLTLSLAIERLEDWLHELEVARRPKPQKAVKPPPPKVFVEKGDPTVQQLNPPAGRGRVRGRIAAAMATTIVLAGGGFAGFQQWGQASTGDGRTSNASSPRASAAPAGLVKVARIASFTGPALREVSFNGDGTVMAVNVQSQSRAELRVPAESLQFWDMSNPATPRLVAKVTLPRSAFERKGASIDSLALSADGSKMAVCALSTVTLWDITQRDKIVKIAALPKKPTAYDGCAATFSPNGSLLGTTVGGSHQFYLWDITGARPRLASTITTPGSYVDEVHFASDGKSILVSAYRDAGLWDISDPAHPRFRHLYTDAPLSDFLSDDRVVTMTWEGRLQLWDASAKPKLLWRSKSPKLNFLGFSVDRARHRVYTASDAVASSTRPDTYEEPSLLAWSVDSSNSSMKRTTLPLKGFEASIRVLPDGKSALFDDGDPENRDQTEVWRLP